MRLRWAWMNAKIRLALCLLLFQHAVLLVFLVPAWGGVGSEPDGW